MTIDTRFRGSTYAYDANGRQKSASNGTWTETQVYDAVGRRVQTGVSSSTRTQVFDIFGQDVADYTGTAGGILERENIYRGGVLLAAYEAATSSLKYVFQDLHGSARLIMNNSGGGSTVIARNDYLPFGAEIGVLGLRTTGQGYNAADSNRQKYAQLETDDTSGLNHSWFRKYENLSGSWTSPDPYGGGISIGDPQSNNRYSYVQEASNSQHLDR